MGCGAGKEAEDRGDVYRTHDSPTASPQDSPGKARPMYYEENEPQRHGGTPTHTPAGRRSIVTFDNTDASLQQFCAFDDVGDADSRSPSTPASLGRAQFPPSPASDDETLDEAAKVSRRCSLLLDQVIGAPIPASRRSSQRHSISSGSLENFQRRMSFAGRRQSAITPGLVRCDSVHSAGSSSSSPSPKRKKRSQTHTKTRLARGSLAAGDTMPQSNRSMDLLDEALELMSKASMSDRATLGGSETSEPEGAADGGCDDVSTPLLPPQPGLPADHPPLPAGANETVLLRYLHSYTSPSTPRCETVENAAQRPQLVADTLVVLDELTRYAPCDAQATREVLATWRKAHYGDGGASPRFSFARRRSSKSPRR